MTKTLSAIAVVLFAALLGGCEKQGIFYWGDYSDTYYAQAKNPSEQTHAAHLKSLENIIAQSKTKNLAVPPGVFAEYGYFMLKQGKTDLAKTYFEQEKALYPESRIFMDRLIASIGTREDSSDPKEETPGDINSSSTNDGSTNPSAEAQATSN